MVSREPWYIRAWNARLVEAPRMDRQSSQVTAVICFARSPAGFADYEPDRSNLGPVPLLTLCLRAAH